MAFITLLHTISQQEYQQSIRPRIGFCSEQTYVDMWTDRSQRRAQVPHAGYLMPDRCTPGQISLMGHGKKQQNIESVESVSRELLMTKMDLSKDPEFITAIPKKLG
jgi:hypothetical protein